MGEDESRALILAISDHLPYLKGDIDVKGLGGGLLEYVGGGYGVTAGVVDGVAVVCVGSFSCVNRFYFQRD